MTGVERALQHLTGPVKVALTRKEHAEVDRSGGRAFWMAGNHRASIRGRGAVGVVVLLEHEAQVERGDRTVLRVPGLDRHHTRRAPSTSPLSSNSSASVAALAACSGWPVAMARS
jgi:hypothetical protein